MATLRAVPVVILSVFPTVLLLSAPLRVLKDTVIPDFDPQGWPFISSDGFLNTFLAGHSFEIFTVLLIALNCYKFWLASFKTPLLPVTEEGETGTRNNNTKYNYLQSHISDNLLLKQIEPTSPDGSTHKSVTTRYVCFQMLKLLGVFVPISACIVWFFGPSLYDRIHYLTGGSCINHPEYKYYGSCSSHGFKYASGFKSSGHSLITSTFASCIAFETLDTNVWIQYINSLWRLPYHLSYMGHLLVLFTTSVYFCWLIMFTVTCLFYHTLMERIIGTVCGLLIVYFIYVKCKL